MVVKRSMNSAVAFPSSLWLLLVATIISFEFCFGGINPGCSSSEREALLKFKHDLSDPSNRLASWAGNGDCCRWSGVFCSNVTGHVLELHIRGPSFEEYLASHGTGDSDADHEAYMGSKLGGKISQSLLNLKHLRYLDLSNNNFGGTKIPKFLGFMESLRYLNLSLTGFRGMIPHELGNLSNLQYLHIQDDYYGIYDESLLWLSSLSSLEFLSLSGVDLSRAFNWLKVLNSLPSLVELHLDNCQLYHMPNPPLFNVNFSSLSILDLSFNFFDQSLVGSWIFRLTNVFSLSLASNDFKGPIPVDLQNMTSLNELDLSSNNFNSSIPEWLYDFSHLEFLDLSDNNLQGKISSDIRNLTSLIALDLSYNKFKGIPRSLKTLCKLRFLSMSGVKLRRDIDEVFEILSSGCVSNELKSLNLGDCQLFGHLTDHLGKFKNLTKLSLEENSISGPIPLSLGEMTSLRMLDLSSNKLNGTLPLSFGGLARLEKVDFSYNSLEGEVSEIHFSNLTKLRGFCASRNQLILRVGPNWIPPPQLEAIYLESWHIGHIFPIWLHSLKHLQELDLSNSGIFDTIPVWFWNPSSKFDYLNLSHNQIIGVIPNEFKVVSAYSLVDLSSNNFKGPIPHIFSNASGLDLSNNSFSGSISNFLCYQMHELKVMKVLNLGENSLSGEIPDCWTNWQELLAIRLSNNKFTGRIPWSIGSLRNLESLHLRNNNLLGEIPLSLKNCTELVTLDFGDNELTGKIPAWMGKRLSLSMVILILRGNKFHGHISQKLCHLESLQIMDLAHNNLSGAIPSCFNKFNAMARIEDSTGKINTGSFDVPFLEDELLVMKGKVVEYSSILDLVRSIDLSNNNLSGEIPNEITRLGALLSLNLSLNSLSGKIPVDIGAMRSLESVDFSQNQLSGAIPLSLGILTFLSHLNLSYNNLSGRIPTGTQLQSFSSSSFIGNKYLCGPPLSKSCFEYVPPASGNGRGKGDNGLDVDWWFFVSMALGFPVGFWAVVGPLVFNRRWRCTYFHFLDRLGHKFQWSFK